MADQLTVADAAALLDAVAVDLIAAKDDLTQLDAALGDGDLGRTIERGFNAVRAELSAGTGEADLGRFLFQQGKVFNTAAASSFGTLFSTLLQKSGQALKGQESASLPELVNALQAGFDALKERGKANVGDKTMLDALHPALEAMRAVLAGSDAPTLAALLRAGADAADAGAAQTTSMQSQIGRASWKGERSVGHEDPGARAIALMLASAARWAEAQE
jgi:phosphoenolpyruvate---glycerone phosphotransferase subunit DhaL